MRWNPEGSLVWSSEPVHEALVTRDMFDAVKARMAKRASGKGGRAAPRTNRSYSLRHRVRCGVCGRYMQGAMSGGHTYYRCKFAAAYAHATSLGHPRSVNLREDHLLPKLDSWLAGLFGADHLDETCQAMAATAGAKGTLDTSAIKAAIRDCDRKLERHRQALEAGADPVLVAGWIKQAAKERAGAEAQLREAELTATETVTVAQLRAGIEAIGGLLPLLQSSDPQLKSSFYEEVGLESVYDPEAQMVEACVLNGRVGEPTCNFAPRRKPTCRRTDLQVCSTPPRDGKWLVRPLSGCVIRRPTLANGVPGRRDGRYRPRVV